MNCPRCGSHQVNCKNNVRKLTTVAGASAGGYVALSSTSTGAAIGSAICPGLGTIAGGIIGFICGVGAGGITGHRVGKMIDEKVIGTYRCQNCGNEWQQ